MSSATQVLLSQETAASSVVPDDAVIPIHLHPLVLLSVSDHVTRMKYLRFHETNKSGADGSTGHPPPVDGHDESETAPVIGVMLGQVEDEGRAVGVVMSYEAVYLGADGDELKIPRPPPPREEEMASPQSSADTETELQRQRRWYISQIDWEALQQKRERLRQVFPECGVVGWYTVGRTLGDLACCAAVHENICRLFGNAEEDGGQQQHSPNKAQDGAQDGIGGAPGRMLSLLLEANPVGLASAALPTYMYETQLHHGPTSSRGNEEEDKTHSAATQQQQNQRQSLQSRTASGGAYVTFTPIRYQLESEEIEHVAVDAALNIDLYAAQQLQQQYMEAAGSRAGGGGQGGAEQRHSWPYAADMVGSFEAQALQRGAQLKPTLARARRSLLLLRLRVKLGVAYLDTLAERLAQGADKDEGGLTHTDADALRLLHLVASQLPGTPPALAGAPTETQSTGPRSSDTVVDAELESTLTTALFALESQVAVGLDALQHKQAHVWSTAVEAVMAEARSRQAPSLGGRGHYRGYGGWGE